MPSQLDRIELATVVRDSNARRRRSGWGLVVWCWLTLEAPLAAPDESRAAPPPHFVAWVGSFGLTAVANRGTPVVGDLDGDGDLDVLEGQQNGKLNFFRNTGSSESPSFAPPSIDPFGLGDVGSYVAPTLADIDGDGDLDVFVGDVSGTTFFFRNTGTSESPAFAASSANPFGLLPVTNSAAPTFVDIDGDGDLDAFVGGFGAFSFFLNTGTSSSPAFAAPATHPFHLPDLDDLKPAFADLDGDGDLDVFLPETSGVIYGFTNTGTVESPAFGQISRYPFGIVAVDLEPAPVFADIDGDGDVDVFFGGKYGSMFFFENTGTPQSPAFFNDVRLATSTAAKPTFADIDGDGDLDAFVGNGYGSVNLQRNTGTSESPAFAPKSVNPFGLVDVGDRSAPAFADLDADGDLDLIVGNAKGLITFFPNTGVATSPAFGPASVGAFGLDGVDYRATPALVDIDGDGDFDVFVGEIYASALYFFENTGTAQNPGFVKRSGSFGLTNVGNDAAPTFVDIDRDGDLDAFVGEHYGTTVFFENTGTSQSPAFVKRPDSFGLTDVSAFAAPTFVDIDDDGDFDAFVGDAHGTTFFFENQSYIRVFGDGFESGNLDAWSAHAP